MEDSCTMYGINQSRKTRLSGCLLARLPLAGPPRRGLSCLCFWPPRPPLRGEAVSGLFASPPRRIWRTARRRVHGRVSFLFPRRLHSAPPKLPISRRAVIQRGGAGPTKQVRSRLSQSQSDFSRLSKLHQARLWVFFNRRCHLMMTSSFTAAVK